MTSYERSITVHADLEAVFGYLSEVRNLPKYMESMTSAEPADGDAVLLTAMVDLPGQGKTEVHREAWFRVDHDAHRIEWGSEGDNDYHGSIEASAASGGAATELVMSLHTLVEHGDRINAGLDATLVNLERATDAS